MYALAIAALFIFILPAVAQDIADKPGLDDKQPRNDFDKLFLDGSFDWMLLLDKATLDDLKNMSPEEIEALKQDTLEQLREMSPDELDKLRSQNMKGFKDRFNNMPREDFDRLKFPWQEDQIKKDEHKPVKINGYMPVKDAGYNPFVKKEADDDKPPVKTDDNKPIKDAVEDRKPIKGPVDGFKPFNSSEIYDPKPLVNGNQKFNSPDQFNQNHAMMPDAGFVPFNNQPAGQPGPR